MVIRSRWSTMLVSQHRSNATRLLGAVVALALVIAQVIGAYAHAAEHDHGSGHAACAHHHGHGPATPSGDGPADTADHDADRAHHGASCDFLCHGGIAILMTVAFRYADPGLPYIAAVAADVHPAAPPSLERPPRSSART